MFVILKAGYKIYDSAAPTRDYDHNHVKFKGTCLNHA